ncbi:glycerophosphodiester phosphodiesterase [Phytoactinopolyspora limicola]|uniref:glycerophosphodiester phosphodiesterase n=1 Tax=Phytoactinopolyspora limicola TaxID=2715536 RepID=UPI00140D32B2|nr:glycerophosphodiester phosphodiesterase family protein [Phytoactinopolyspora limicola]
MDFVNCGHRGAMAVAPENTMVSFQLAAELGANEVELDLRLSKDGVLVVVHDATVERTTNGAGAVADLTYAELRSLDAGDGQPIPTFEEVLDGTTVALQAEIKAPEAVDPLVALLNRRPRDAARVSPCSFDPDVVAELARRRPSNLVGWIGREASPAAVHRARTLGAGRILFGWPGMDDDLVGLARELDLHVNVWPVNTPDQVHAAAALGVDGFTTDQPSLLFDTGYTIRDGRLAPKAS